MNNCEHMNRAQLEAVTWTGGPLLVLAGPGSGKTFTIVNRILHLLRQGTPPERILVITFTREAALSMERRFRTASGGCGPVNFGTFHSVFFQILQRSNTLRSAQLLSTSEKNDLLIPILQTYQRNSGRSRYREELREDAAAFLTAVSCYKNTLTLESAQRKVPAEYREAFPELLNEYQRVLEASGKLDFDDMLSRCRKVLTEDAAQRKSWQDRFSHILIDEFQDINPVQYEVIKLLAGEDCRIFAVGDDDQAIYGFRGSRPECLRRFQREYRAEKILLDVNYRSSPQIIKASLAVIGENKERYDKRLRPDPHRAEGEKVRLLSFEDGEGQNAYLTERLKKFLREQALGEECAVLFRTNARMQRLALELGAAGIPYVMNAPAQSIYQHFIARDVTSYLTLASGDWHREPLLRVINKPSRYVSREAVGQEVSGPEDLRQYYRCRQDLSAENRERILEALYNFEKQLKAMSALSPGLAVTYVRKAAGYQQYLEKLAGQDREKWEEWRDILDWLREDASRFSCVKEWRKAQEEQIRQIQGRRDTFGSGKGAGIVPGNRDSAPGKDPKGDSVPRVRLMTVHGSKGLEFHTVILPDCNENVFPHGSMPDREEVEEERRIFYVAMTRAKENLELLYLTGSGERPRLPSRFLKPLLSDHSSSISSSNSQLSRYSSKASATFSYSSSSSR